MAVACSRDEARAKLREMGERRKVIEEEMEALTETLSTTGAGVQGKLVDAEGFPRADIDVHQTLVHRNRMAGASTSSPSTLLEIALSVPTGALIVRLRRWLRQFYRPIIRASWHRSKSLCL